MPSSKYAELLARYEEELHRGEPHSGTLGELAAARIEGGAGGDHTVTATHTKAHES